MSNPIPLNQNMLNGVESQQAEGISKESGTITILNFLEAE